MSEILLSDDNLFAESDKFIVNNMLTDEDLDLDLSPYVWHDLSSDSNVSSVNSSQYECSHHWNGLTPPETPPSSDRSSPPNVNDITALIAQQSSPFSPQSASNHAIQSAQSSQLFIENNNHLPNVTIFPAVVSLSPPPISPVSPFVTLAANAIPNCDRFQLSQLKREARKLRNREAASVSRKRKKDYVDGLEGRVNCLMRENADLRIENEKLKCKVSDLEKENRELTRKQTANQSATNCGVVCDDITKNYSGNNTISNKRATLSLLAVIFMLGFNLAPFSGILVTHDRAIAGVNSNARPELKAQHGSGRSLLWKNNDESNVPIDVIAVKEVNYNSSSVKSGNNCKTYINQTESLRLESDLRGWALRVEMEKEEVKLKKRIMKSNLMKDRLNKPFPLTRLKAWMQRQELDADIRSLDDDNRLDLFKRDVGYPHIKYEDLLSAIHRRDDTFYFLSFSAGDHMIIPPAANNGTEIRPRFSIIMPSVSTLNESSTSGTNITYHQIAMMQIDCEVINTKMVLIKNLLLSEGKPSHESSGAQQKSVRTRITQRKFKLFNSGNNANKTKSKKESKK